MRPIPVAFHFFWTPLVIHTYGIGLAVTFWFGYRYLERRLRYAGYPWEWLTGVFLWVIVSAIVGARAVHVAANWSLYAHDPGQILQIWNGGLSSFGGLLGAVPVGIITTRRACRELTAMKLLDLVAPVLMASWGIGRLLGPQLMINGGGHPTSQWFGMEYANGAGGYTPKELPVPIFQAVESFLIFGVLIYLERRFPKRPTGFIISATMALWGLERLAEQHLWLTDSSRVGSDLVQGAGLALFAAGVLTMVFLMRRQRRGAGLPAVAADGGVEIEPDPVPVPVPVSASGDAEDEGDPTGGDAGP